MKLNPYPMKFISLILFGLVVTMFSFGQTDYTYDLTVKTRRGQPDIGRKVVFVEANTYERMTFKTDASGKLTTQFDHGTTWLCSVGEMRNCLQVNLGNGGTGSGRAQITYDPEGYAREHQTLPDRRSIHFTMKNQERLSPMSEPERGFSIVTIVLRDRQEKKHSGIEIQLVCFENETIYTGKSNHNGAASFRLPNNHNFQIDVDGVQDLNWIDLGEQSVKRTQSLLFQPRTFTEKIEDGFIVQNLPKDVKPSSSHARIKLKVRGGPKGGIQEDVYIRMMKSNDVYKAKTDDDGDVTLMLPIRAKYFVDFLYQRGAEQIDLSRVKGIALQEKTINYEPDPRLSNIENFIPTIEELIEFDMHNFVEAHYPEPTQDNVEFYLKWGNKFNVESKEALLEVGMSVKYKDNIQRNIPLNICFVIDKSGSMMGADRIEQLKQSLIDFIGELDAKDIVSIVVFESDARLAVPAEPLGDKQKAIDIIHAIQAGGGTNIYNGMVMGFDEVLKKKSSHTVNRLILLTDGYGAMPPQEVIDKAKSYIAKGVELSAIGVGTGYNEALLTQLASAGGGHMHLAGTSTNIQEAFQAELRSILSPMAKDAQLTVKYNDAIVYRQLFGYHNEVVTKGQMQVEIPHLFAGLSKMALIKFDLHHPTPAIVDQKVEVTLEYTDIETGKKVVRTKNCKPEWTDATGELDMAIDKEHKKAMAVAVANQSLKVMSEAFHSGDRAKAEAAVRNAMEQIRQLFPDAQPTALLELTETLKEYVWAFENIKIVANSQN